MAHPYRKSPLNNDYKPGQSRSIKDLNIDNKKSLGVSLGPAGLILKSAGRMLSPEQPRSEVNNERFAQKIQDIKPFEVNNADTALPSPVDKVAKTTKGKGRNFRSTEEGAGMTEKGVKAYKKENPGSKLQTAVTGDVKPGSKAEKRRKSFCARSKGWTGERGKAARRRWKC